MPAGRHQYKRVCQGCGEDFVATHPAAKYHSDACRKRKTRAFQKASAEAAVATPPAEPQASPSGSVYAAVLQALTDANRVDTWKAQAALALAHRADTVTAAMGYAPIIKELRSTMEEALSGAAVKKDPLDELRAKRDQKRSAGNG